MYWPVIQGFDLIYMIAFFQIHAHIDRRRKTVDLTSISVNVPDMNENNQVIQLTPSGVEKRSHSQNSPCHRQQGRFLPLVLRLLAIATVGVALALPAQIISGVYTGALGNASGGYVMSLALQPSGRISSLQFEAMFQGFDNYQGTYYSSISAEFYDLPPLFSVTSGSPTGQHRQYLVLTNGVVYPGSVSGDFSASEFDSWYAFPTAHTASGAVSGRWVARVSEYGPIATSVNARPTSLTGTNFDVIVTFSKVVSGVDAGDLSLSGTAVTPSSTVGTPYSTNSGTQWVFPITGLAYDGMLYNVLCKGNQGIWDARSINVGETSWAFSTVRWPEISTQPASRTNAVGTQAQFSVAASGWYPPFSYQWRKNGTPLLNGSGIAGANTAVLTLSSVDLASAGGYQVVITNTYGAVTSTLATLTVCLQPQITLQPQSQTNQPGTSATFSVGVTGTPPFSYQWRKDSVNLAGATGNSLNFTNLQAASAGTYSVVVSGPGGGSTTSQAAVLWVLRTLEITAQPRSCTNLAGSTATLSVSAIGTAALSYQWRMNGIDLPGATNQILMLANAQPGQSGSYSVSVTNAYGSVLSQAAWLDVRILAAWGDNSYGQTNIPAGLTNVVAIAVGYEHSLALRADGTVAAWGRTLRGRRQFPPG